MFAFLCRPLETERHRGGWRQRIAARVATANPGPPRMGLRHLRNWGDGLASAKEVIANMADAVQDGEVKHPMIHRLAKIQGVPAQGLADLMTACGIALPIEKIPGGTLVTDFARPSSLLKLLLDNYPAKFEQALGCDDQELLAGFWQELLRRAPEVRNLAWCRGTTYDDWKRMVPLTMHEDAGPYTKRLSANIVSFGGLLGRGGEKMCQYPIISYIKERRPTDEELESMWNPILLDFEDLAHRGVGPWRFVLLYVKSDLEVRSVVWGLPSFNSTEPCTECRADCSGRPFTDLRTNASWRDTVLDSSAAFLERARRPLHPLLSSSLFWRGFMPLDLMHLLECNGAANIVAGSILQPLTQRRELGASQAQRLAHINSLMLEWQQGHRGMIRMPPFRLANLESNEWACLSGPTIKAANTRSLAPFLVLLAEKFYDPNTEEGRNVQRIARCLQRMYQILYSSGLFLTDAELNEFRRVLSRFGASFQTLRALAEADNRMLWHIIPKVHISQHLSTQAAVMNPRFCQNYTEESQIGTATRIWKRSASGKYRSGIQRLVLLKRLVGFVVRFDGVLDS